MESSLLFAWKLANLGGVCTSGFCIPEKGNSQLNLLSTNSNETKKSGMTKGKSNDDLYHERVKPNRKMLQYPLSVGSCIIYCWKSNGDVENALFYGRQFR